jgi:hypothetical protein
VERARHKLAPALANPQSRKSAVSRDYEPVAGQWYENVEEEESFRVLSLDEDSETVEIEYLDGDIEEIDIEAWHEMDLEMIQEPEGWAGGDDEDEEEEDEEEDDEDEDEDEDEDDDDWDEDEDDDDLDEDEEDVEEGRDQY